MNRSAAATTLLVRRKGSQVISTRSDSALGNRSGGNKLLALSQTVQPAIGDDADHHRSDTWFRIQATW